MKKTIITVGAILAIICLVLISFMGGLVYYQHQNVKFDKSHAGMKVNDNRKIWGKPGRSRDTLGTITDTYYLTDPVNLIKLNKYVFCFNKKDSLMNQKWKEY